MAKGMRHLVIVPFFSYMYVIKEIIKGSLGGETSVLRTFRMSGK